VYHYVALIWNPLDANAAAVASRLGGQLSRNSSEWIRVLDLQGLHVFQTTPSARAFSYLPLPDRRGVILGRLFPAKLQDWNVNWTPAISEHGASLIVNSCGRHLVENFWGAYIAFLRDSQSGAVHAIRDCSGRLPCYRTNHENVTIFFSDISDLDPLGLPPFTINQKYLAGFLFSSQLQIRECALDGIWEILAGEIASVCDGKVEQRSLWHPGSVCRNTALIGTHDNISSLRETTAGCIDAWASAFDRILLNLSGGLDSSIVLGCLRHSSSSPDIVCLNRFSSHAREDERAYARIAAKRADVQLVEEQFYAQRRPLDERLLSSRRSVKPTIPAIISVLDLELRNRIAKRFNSDAIWTGEGGDHLFIQSRTSLGAADYLADHGYGPRFLKAVGDSARLSREPYFTVFQQAVALRKSRDRWAPNSAGSGNGHFLNPQIDSSALQSYVANPWTTEIDDLPKGKQYQIRSLAEVLNRHRPYPADEYAFEHHPLLSQPLIELTLRIPIYDLLRDGRQRGLARCAFTGQVPPEILAREDKGESTVSVIERIRQSESFIRDLTLDGLLVRQGLIDRKALEPYLLYGQPTHVDNLFPFLTCVAAEIWAQSWSRASLEFAA